MSSPSSISSGAGTIVQRPCRRPGCAGFAVAGSRWCATHAAYGQQQKAAHVACLDQQRGSAAARGYDSRWQKARRTFLAQHAHRCVGYAGKKSLVSGPSSLVSSPVCLNPATIVDHIVPHRGNQALFWDSSNWQCLCKPCHDRKTATEDGGFRGSSEQRVASSGHVEPRSVGIV